MSNDEEWIDLGRVGDFHHSRASEHDIERLFDEVREHAPYGLEHRRVKPEDSLSFPVLRAQFNFQIRNQPTKEALLEETKESIKRLLRNPLI